MSSFIDPSPDDANAARLAQRRAYMAAYAAANRERMRAYHNDYNAKNREKVNKASRESQARIRQQRREQERPELVVAERRAAERQRQKSWVAANPEKVEASKQRYKERHPTAAAEANKKYRETHKDEIRQQFRAKFAADPAKYQALNKKWRQENKDRLREKQLEARANESPRQREARLTASRDTRRLGRELAKKGLPSPRTHRASITHVAARLEGANAFFARKNSEIDWQRLRREVEHRGMVPQSKASVEKTPQADLDAWAKDSRLARGRFARVANMAMLAEKGRLTSHVHAIAAGVMAIDSYWLPKQQAINSRARQARGQGAFDVDRAVRARALAEARVRFEKQMRVLPESKQSDALRAMDALRASYPKSARRSPGEATPPAPTRREFPRTPRNERGPER